jgi:hypothetical protein
MSEYTDGACFACVVCGKRHSTLRNRRHCSCGRTTPTPTLTVPRSDVSGTATAGLATTRTNNTTGANLASLTSPTGWNGPGRSTQEDGNGRLCAFGGGGTSYGVGRSNNTTGANLASLTSSPRGSTLSNVPNTTDKVSKYPDGGAFTCKCGQQYLTIPQLSNCRCNRTNPNPTTPTTTTTTTTTTAMHQGASSFSSPLLSIPLAFGPTHTDHVCAMCGQEGTSTLECPVCYPVPPSDASRMAPNGLATNLTGAGQASGDDGSGGLFSRGGSSTSYGVGRSNNTRGANSASLASATGGSTSSNVPTTTDSDLRRRFRRVRQVPAPVFPPVAGVLTKSSQNQINKIKEYIKSDASGMVKQIVDLLMKENFLEWSTTTGCQEYKHRNTGWLALKLLADTIFHPEATMRWDRAKSMGINYGDQSWKDGTERLVALDYIVQKEKESKKKQINKNGNKSSFVTMTTERSPSFFVKLRPISPHYTSPHPLSSVARRLSIPTDILPPDDASIDASPTSPGAYSVPENSDDALDAVMEDANEDVGLSTQSTEANAADLASDSAMADSTIVSTNPPLITGDSITSVKKRKPDTSVAEHSSSGTSPGCEDSFRHDDSIDTSTGAAPDDTSVTKHSCSLSSPGCDDSPRHDRSISESTSAALEDYDDNDNNGNDFPHDYQSLYIQLFCTEEEEQQEEVEQNTIPDLVVDGGGDDGGDDGDGGGGNGGMSLTPPVSEEEEEQQEEVEQNTIPDLVVDGGGGGGDDGGDDGGGSGGGGDGDESPVAALEDTFRPENMVGDGDDAQTDRVEQDYRSTIAALEDEYFQKMMRPWL